MSYEQEMAKRGTILSTISGSHLYGTNTPESDIDKVGVFIPDIEYLIGLKNIEQVDLSIKSKNEAGKNTKEAQDETLYSLKKYINLALDNNPNIIELLFTNKKNIVFINNIGKELMSLRYDFLSKNIKHKFLGYAFSQRKKATIKLENYEIIEEVIEFLKTSDKDFLNEIQHPCIIRNNKMIKIADTNMPANITIKVALGALDRRRKKFGNRKELVTKYGFDVKFMMHTIRLMYEGIELLTTGNLIFPLKEKELLTDIRNGRYSFTETLKLSYDLEKNIEDLYNTTKLPNTPNKRRIEDFFLKINKNFICKN